MYLMMFAFLLRPPKSTSAEKNKRPAKIFCVRVCVFLVCVTVAIAVIFVVVYFYLYLMMFACLLRPPKSCSAETNKRPAKIRRR